jgi:predicted RNase H-like HicB family nuclease
MNDLRYIPIEKNFSGRSYVFHVELAQKSNGYWIAWIATLPGCAAWGCSKDEVLEAITKTAQMYIRTLCEKGVHMPDGVTAMQAPVIAVTV